MADFTGEQLKQELAEIGIRPENSAFTYHDAMHAIKRGLELGRAAPEEESATAPEDLSAYLHAVNHGGNNVSSRIGAIMAAHDDGEPLLNSPHLGTKG